MVWATTTLAFFTILFSSCTVMNGNENGYTYASIGGNAEGLNISSGGASATKIDNSTGAAIAKEAISDMASAYVLGKAFDAAGRLIEDGFDAIEDANDTDEAIAKSNNLTKAEIETFVPPEPVPTQP